MDKISPVIDGIRRIVERWTITRAPLSVSANAGDDIITLRSTKRFNVDEEIVIHNYAEDMENELFVKEIVSDTQLRLNRPLKWDWSAFAAAPLPSDPDAYEGAYVVKLQNGQFIKAVHYGEPDVITNLPAITVSVTNANSEFFTVRSTKERYNLEIGVFVSADTYESGERFLAHLVDVIRTGLKRNFYPLLDDYELTSLAADAESGDAFLRVSDVNILNPKGNQVIIEDYQNIEVHFIESICPPDTVRLAQLLQNNFSATDTKIIKPNRLPFNSWPSDINFGKIRKGTLLKAAVISYFIEEMEDQFQAGISDPQLS